MSIFNRESATNVDIVVGKVKYFKLDMEVVAQTTLIHLD